MSTAEAVALLADAFLAIALRAYMLQARELIRQTRLLSSANRGILAYNIGQMMQEWSARFLEYPELRPYFYAGLETPLDDPLRTRVQVLAEMFVDFIDMTLTN